MSEDEETRARAAGMKRAGMTNKQIAARLGCTESQAIRLCRKVKAYRRPSHIGGTGQALSFVSNRIFHAEDLTGEI